MIDRQARHEMAVLIRRVVTRQMSVYDFQDEIGKIKTKDTSVNTASSVFFDLDLNCDRNGYLDVRIGRHGVTVGSLHA